VAADSKETSCQGAASIAAIPSHITLRKIKHSMFTVEQYLNQLIIFAESGLTARQSPFAVYSRAYLWPALVMGVLGVRPFMLLLSRKTPYWHYSCATGQADRSGLSLPSRPEERRSQHTPCLKHSGQLPFSGLTSFIAPHYLKNRL
jgi:hypothetical protein